jgi:hypothetical protein
MEILDHTIKGIDSKNHDTFYAFAILDKDGEVLDYAINTDSCAENLKEILENEEIYFGKKEKYDLDNIDIILIGTIGKTEQK